MGEADLQSFFTSTFATPQRSVRFDLPDESPWANSASSSSTSALSAGSTSTSSPNSSSAVSGSTAQGDATPSWALWSDPYATPSSYGASGSPGSPSSPSNTSSSTTPSTSSSLSISTASPMTDFYATSDPFQMSASSSLSFPPTSTSFYADTPPSSPRPEQAWPPLTSTSTSTSISTPGGWPSGFLDPSPNSQTAAPATSPSSSSFVSYPSGTGAGATSHGEVMLSQIPLPISLGEDPHSTGGPKDGQTIRFQETEFDVRSMYRNSPLAFIGAIRSGKSKLIAWILQLMRFRRVVAFLGGSDGLPWYRHFIPDIFVHDYCKRKFDSAIVERIIRHQSDIFALKESCKPALNHVDIELCMIFEDLAFDDIFRKDPTLIKLVTTTRRLLITSIWSAQYANSFSTKIRGSFENSFLFRIEGRKEQEWCYDMYNGGAFTNVEVFIRVWMNITSVPFQCMVITRNHSDPSKRVQRLKAPNPPDPEKGDKIDYAVDQMSVIFHHLFYQPSTVENPWVPYYKAIFGNNPQEKVEVRPSPEVVHHLGKGRGTLDLVYQQMPKDPELNKMVPVHERVVVQALPRPPPPGTGVTPTTQIGAGTGTLNPSTHYNTSVGPGQTLAPPPFPMSLGMW